MNDSDREAEERIRNDPRRQREFLNRCRQIAGSGPLDEAARKVAESDPELAKDFYRK